MGKRRLSRLFLALLALSPALVTAQEVVDFAEFQRPRRMIYFFRATEDEFTPVDRFVLYSSVLMAVGNANPNVVVLESPDPEVPETEAGKHELARVINADAWLYVNATGGMENIRVEVETFDILTLEVKGRTVIEPGFPLDHRQLSRGFWDALVETVSTSYGAVMDTLEVTVRGLPGTQVTGLTAVPLKIEEQGLLTLTLPNPATYTMLAQAPGYYPKEITFYLGYESMSMDLEQSRAARFAVDTYLNNLQFLGARFWFFPIPATLYLRLGVTAYALGLYLVDGTPSIVAGNPLTWVGLDTGVFFIRPGGSVRLYAGAGAFLRIVHAVGLFGFEPTAPGGFEGTLGLEASPWISPRFFVEYAPVLYLSPDPAEFRRRTFPTSLYPGGVVPGYLFLEGAILDYRNVSVGIRFSW